MIWMDKYKVSVVVPTFNTGDFLVETFESFRCQTIGFENIEIIFVDDASSDDYTLDLLDEFDSCYSNVSSVFLDVNSGFPGTGRNVGLDLAQGECVIFADHDDTYEENAFEVMYNEIVSENVDMVICNFNQVFPDRSVPFKSIFKNSGKIKVNSFKEEPDLLRIPAAIWTRMFRREFLQKNNINFIEGMLAEDVHLAINASFKASGIIYLNDFYGYNYKIRDSVEDKSTIHVRNRKYIEAILDGYYEIDRLLNDENKVSYGKKIFKSHLTSWLYTIVLSKLSNSDKLILFRKSYNLFDNFYMEDPFFKGKYKKLVNHIINREFEKAVDESNYLENIQENINYKTGKSRIKRLLNKFKR